MDTNSCWLPSKALAKTSSFFIDINDHPKGLKRKAKVFADDTSISSIVKDKNESAKDHVSDLSLISR